MLTAPAGLATRIAPGDAGSVSVKLRLLRAEKLLLVSTISTTDGEPWNSWRAATPSKVLVTTSGFTTEKLTAPEEPLAVPLPAPKLVLVRLLLPSVALAGTRAVKRTTQVVPCGAAAGKSKVNCGLVTSGAGAGAVKLQPPLMVGVMPPSVAST